MRRRSSIVGVASVLLLTCFLAGERASHAQELDGSASPDTLDDPGAERRLFFVPRLGGALSLDTSVAYRFQLGNDDRLPTSSVGGSLGYRHFFDWHGKLSIRGYGALRYGGLGSSVVDGEIWQYGGGLSFHGRGYTDNWAFGGIGIYTEFLATSWSPPRGRLGDSGDELGWQWSGGLETDFGQLITADPYIFAESAALFGLNYIDVGPWSSWSIDARWVVRFDWAWRPSVGK